MSHVFPEMFPNWITVQNHIFKFRGVFIESFILIWKRMALWRVLRRICERMKIIFFPQLSLFTRVGGPSDFSSLRESCEKK